MNNSIQQKMKDMGELFIKANPELVNCIRDKSDISGAMKYFHRLSEWLISRKCKWECRAEEKESSIPGIKGIVHYKNYTECGQIYPNNYYFQEATYCLKCGGEIVKEKSE